MEVLLGLFVLALIAAGPIGFLLALSLRGRIHRLEEQLRRLEKDSHESSTSNAPIRPMTPAPPWPLRSPAPVDLETETPTPPAAQPVAPASSGVDPWSAARSAAAGATPLKPGSPIPPIPTPARSTPSTPERKVEDWEQYVGGSLLNRVGITLLVLGIAFALGYTFNQLDAVGKSALSTGVSVVLIVSGCLLERKERFAYQGRGLVAGGWAALYVTVYAMHGLEATRVIEDVRVGFVLLLLVGGGMIVHSLRYSRQSVTAIAYSLAYASIVIHSIHAYTIVASIVLGAGTLLHLFRRDWRGIALLGLAASYGSIVLWFQRQAFIDTAALHLALAAIGVNWLVFLAADLRATAKSDEAGAKPNDARDLGVLAAWSNATAAVLLATLVHFQSKEPGHHLPALVAGIGYVLTAIVGTLRKMPIAASTHPILAAAALGYAAWLGLDLEGASWVWLAEAELAFLIGLRRGDTRLRTFGALAFLAPLLGLARDQLPLRAQFSIFEFPGAFDVGTCLFTLTAWACLQFADWKERAIAQASSATKDGGAIATWLSHAATVIVVLAVYVQAPSWTLAPIVATLALAHHEIGRRQLRVARIDQARWLAVTACFFGIFGVMRVAPPSTVLGLPATVVSTLLFATPIYLLCVRAEADRKSKLGLPIGRHVFAWIATFLLAGMVSDEAPTSMRGPYFAAGALALVGAGAFDRSSPLRLPGFYFSACSLVSLLGVSVSSYDRWHELPVAITTTLPSLVLLGIVWWITRQLGTVAEGTRSGPVDEFCGRAIGYGWMVTLFALLSNRMRGHDAILTLPAFVVGLHCLGVFLRDADFRLMSRIAAILMLAAVALEDEVLLSNVMGLPGKVALVAFGVTALIVVGAYERRPPRVDGPPDRRTLALESWLARLPDLSFLLAVAITVIHVGRTREGFGLSVGWALEGLIATIAGFVLKARGLRLGGLFVLALALFVTLWRAFTTFDTIGRIVSFLVLGGVLVLLSLAYAKRRDLDKRPPDTSNSESGRDAA